MEIGAYKIKGLSWKKGYYKDYYAPRANKSDEDAQGEDSDSKPKVYSRVSSADPNS